jgi:hypothetical protein
MSLDPKQIRTIREPPERNCEAIQRVIFVRPIIRKLFIAPVVTASRFIRAQERHSMPRYYFDFEDGANVWRDGEGLDFSEHDHACQQMRLTMLEMARDLTSDDNWSLIGAVRNESGVIWRARLSFAVERLP